MVGTVVGAFAKPTSAEGRGLPKIAVSGAAEVTASGMVGDHNHDRTKKGSTPDQALMLWTEDVRSALEADGWPVAPGDVGENVLLDGVAFADLEPGTRWRLGTAAIEVTYQSDPCSVLRTLPYVGDRLDEFMATLMGRRGMYAKVVEPGEVAAGDHLVRLE